MKQYEHGFICTVVTKSGDEVEVDNCVFPYHVVMLFTILLFLLFHTIWVFVKVIIWQSTI